MRIPPSISRHFHSTPPAEEHDDAAARGTTQTARGTQAQHGAEGADGARATPRNKLKKDSPEVKRAKLLAKHGPVPEQLQGVKDGLEQWDADHQLDRAKVAEALRLVAEGYDEKLGIGERSSKYSRARILMREGCGIDQATYDKAKHHIGMQGLADVYDSAFTVVALGPALAAAAGPGAEQLGEAAGKALKYGALWASSPLSNATGQVIVDGYQDMVAKFQGIPAFSAEITGTGKLNVIRKDIGEQLKEVARHQQDYQRPGATVAERRAALDGLSACGTQLEKLHDDYRKRVALGQANFIKYETQIAYKVTTTPAVVAAGVFGGPLASAGAIAAQQAVQAPFGYMDEILLKDHMMRSNTKYADVLTQAAKDAGKTRNSPDLTEDDIDENKVRKLWTRPMDIVKGNVETVFADELATRSRSLDTLDQEIAKREQNVSRLDRAFAKVDPRRRDGGESPELKRLRQRHAVESQQLRELEQDIHNFRDGRWDRLHATGTIAAMLLSSKEHFKLLTKSKFRRPGEFASQVLDRHGGFSLPRSVAAVLDDSIGLSHIGQPHPEQGATETVPAAGVSGTSPAAGAATQGGVLLGNAYANPVTKFTKQRVTRRQLLGPKTEGPAQQQKKTLRGPKPLQPGLRLQPQIQLNNGQTMTQVDVRDTRAWHMHTQSASYAFMTTLRDTSKSFGTHMKAATTLPYRSVRAGYADRQAKTMREQLEAQLPQERLRVDADEALEQLAARQPLPAFQPLMPDLETRMDADTDIALDTLDASGRVQRGGTADGG